MLILIRTAASGSAVVEGEARAWRERESRREKSRLGRVVVVSCLPCLGSLLPPVACSSSAPLFPRFPLPLHPRSAGRSPRDDDRDANDFPCALLSWPWQRASVSVSVSIWGQNATASCYKNKNENKLENKK